MSKMYKLRLLIINLFSRYVNRLSQKCELFVSGFLLDIRREMGYNNFYPRERKEG